LDEPHAKEVLEKLEAEGYEGFISPLEKADGTYYRVRIGPFAEKARAERAAQAIRKKFKVEIWVTAASN
jgi:DedD protein